MGARCASPCARLEAATPLSMAEIQADKDQLRAEFAMSTRRLELSVEQMKAKTTSQLAELGKKSDAINRLKVELGEKTAAVFAIEAREKALKEQLRASEEEFSVKTGSLREAERALAEKEADLAKLAVSLDERSVVADSQRVEIVALRTQVEALRPRSRTTIATSAHPATGSSASAMPPRPPAKSSAPSAARWRT